ncbi:unnamed protein product [Adineta steineri]|uniref:Uncharacterized protein n=1 Tax=Adineta steineri TaxID=433720 RepID=A0A819T1T6_9BILA|nr:unnamed protein product [Adineta steineri]CAF4149532.1 unnamed protein product [Adineta steineri]
MLVEVIVGFCLSNGNLLFKTTTTGLSHREFQCINDYQLQLNQVIIVPISLASDLTTHSLDLEQQIYYKEITEVCVGSEEQKRQVCKTLIVRAVADETRSIVHLINGPQLMSQVVDKGWDSFQVLSKTKLKNSAIVITQVDEYAIRIRP